MMNVYEKLNLSQSLTPVMDRGRDFSDNNLIVGQHAVRLFDKLGRLKHEELVKNAVVNEGKNSILNAYFNGGTVYPNWYGGLIDNADFVQTLVGDTAASHTGWKEYKGYAVTGDGSIRIPWGQGAASSGQITNSSQMNFGFTSSTSGLALRGIFIVSAEDKDDWSSCYLWSTALFAAVLPIQTGDVLRVAYTVSL